MQASNGNARGLLARPPWSSRRTDGSGRKVGARRPPRGRRQAATAMSYYYTNTYNVRAPNSNGLARHDKDMRIVYGHGNLAFAGFRVSGQAAPDARTDTLASRNRERGGGSESNGWKGAEAMPLPRRQHHCAAGQQSSLFFLGGGGGGALAAKSGHGSTFLSIRSSLLLHYPNGPITQTSQPDSSGGGRTS
jgi:hypothetical protein